MHHDDLFGEKLLNVLANVFCALAWGVENQSIGRDKGLDMKFAEQIHGFIARIQTQTPGIIVGSFHAGRV